jgi:hypothetical protein
VERQLRAFPEQRFFALLWLPQSGKLTTNEARLIVGRCWVAVKKARQPVLASLLSQVANRHLRLKPVSPEGDKEIQRRAN